MDPTEALRLIRAYIAQMKVEDTPVGGVGTSPTFVQHARDLAETVEGLDQWLSRDGFLPADWMAEEDKPMCTIEHGDWTGTACPDQLLPDGRGADVMIEDDVKIIVDLWLAGHLTPGQAISTVATAVGRVERSDDSLYVGYLVTQAASGRPGAIEALVAEASR